MKNIAIGDVFERIRRLVSLYVIVLFKMVVEWCEW